jgi:hypothetical protein
MERWLDGRFPRLGKVQVLDFAYLSSVMMGSISTWFRFCGMRSPAIPAAGPIASDVRFKKRVLGSLAIHFALIPVFPQSEKARCLLEKDTKS